MRRNTSWITNLYFVIRIDEETDCASMKNDTRKRLLNWWIRIECISGSGSPG
jgi:hypothetical protein